MYATLAHSMAAAALPNPYRRHRVTTTRKEVYEVIDGERAYQDAKYPAVNGYSASPEGFLLVVEELSAQARSAITAGKLPPLGDGSVALDSLRKIAATAVRAMEQYGVVPR